MAYIPALHWAQLIRCGRSSFLLVIVVSQPRQRQGHSWNTEADPERGRKVCDWKLPMPTETSPACLLLPSHPKTFLPVGRSHFSWVARLQQGLCGESDTNSRWQLQHERGKS